MEAILGDNSVTSCDVGRVGHTRKKRQRMQNDNIYEGRNFPLGNASYRLFQTQVVVTFLSVEAHDIR